MELLLTLLSNKWAWIGLMLAGLGLSLTIQTNRLEHAETARTALQATFDGFKAQVAAEGKIAQQRADAQAKQDIQRAKEADDEAKKRYASLDAQYSAYRMRQRTSNDTGRSLLPSTAQGAGSNSQVCYSRETVDREFSAALERFRGRLEDSVQPYDKATIVARTCKEWAAR